MIMLGRMLAGGAAGYMMTGDMGGAVGGAAFGGAFLGKRGIGTRFMQKRGGVSGFAQGAVGAIGRAGPSAPSMLRSPRYMSNFGGKSMGIKEFGKMRPNKPFVPSEIGKGLRNVRQAGSAGRNFQNNISKAQNYLTDNAIGVNRMGGYALAGLGTMAASRMGSSAINSNRGY